MSYASQYDQFKKTSSGSSTKRSPLPPGYWALQDAKARFSELVKRAQSDGPQHVTVRGRDEVVILTSAEFRKLKGEQSGEALIAAMQASPYRDLELETMRGAIPVPGVDL